MNTKAEINVSVFPERYKCKISDDGEWLYINYPQFIGIIIESITKFEVTDITIRIQTETTAITLWIETEHTHVTII